MSISTSCVRLTISQVLRVLDFGISTTPWRAFGKSGAGAAMTDHGLPVVVTMAGGYAREIEDVVTIQTNTVAAALAAYA